MKIASPQPFWPIGSPRHGQTTFDARRLDEAITLDDALMYLDSIWGTGDNTFTSDLQPLHETAENFLYPHQLKDLQQKYASTAV